MIPTRIACSPRNQALETFRMCYCSPTTCKPTFNLQGIRSCDRSREQGWREKPSVVRVCRSWGGWLYLCSAISCYLCSAARRNSVSSRGNCLGIADPVTMLYSRRRRISFVWTGGGERTYPVFLANSARVFQIAGPRQAQSSLLEVTIREHVRQTKRVVVLLWKKKSFNGGFRFRLKNLWKKILFLRCDFDCRSTNLLDGYVDLDGYWIMDII